MPTRDVAATLFVSVAITVASLILTQFAMTAFLRIALGAE